MGSPEKSEPGLLQPHRVVPMRTALIAEDQMKHTIEFNLPDEAPGLHWALLGEDMAYALIELREVLIKYGKHRDSTPEAEQVLSDLKGLFFEAIEGIDLDP